VKRFKIQIFLLFLEEGVKGTAVFPKGQRAYTFRPRGLRKGLLLHHPPWQINDYFTNLELCSSYLQQSRTNSELIFLFSTSFSKMSSTIKISQNFAIIKVLLERTVFVENFAIQVQIVTKVNYYYFLF
jgi:hypothetical protein